MVASKASSLNRGNLVTANQASADTAESISRCRRLEARAPTGDVEHIYVPRRRVLATGRKKNYVARYPNLYYLGVGG